MWVELDISCLRSNSRTISPPLSLLEESNGSLWCGVEEWMAESDGGAGSCSIESGGAPRVSVVKHFDYLEASYGGHFEFVEVFVEVEGGVQCFLYISKGCGGYKPDAVKDNEIVLKLLSAFLLWAKTI